MRISYSLIQQCNLIVLVAGESWRGTAWLEPAKTNGVTEGVESTFEILLNFRNIRVYYGNSSLIETIH